MTEREAKVYACLMAAGEIEAIVEMGNHTDSIRPQADNERIGVALLKIAYGLRTEARRHRELEDREGDGEAGSNMTPAARNVIAFLAVPLAVLAGLLVSGDGVTPGGMLASIAVVLGIVALTGRE